MTVWKLLGIQFVMAWVLSLVVLPFGFGLRGYLIMVATLLIIGWVVLAVNMATWWPAHRSRQRASGEAWAAYSEMSRTWLEDMSAGRDPGPIPRWHDPNRHHAS